MVSPTQEAVVEIAAFNVVAGTIRSPQLGKALAWARDTKELLIAKKLLLVRLPRQRPFSVAPMLAIARLRLS